jgi:hypothetical protein
MNKNIINLFSKAQGAFQRGIVAILCTLLIGFFITVSCEEPTALNTTQSDDPALQTTNDITAANLAGTKWKLIGIVDALTSEMTTLEPRDCEECYMLIFDKDSIFTAHSINMTLKLDLLNIRLPDSTVLISEFFCERYYKDGQDYCDSHEFRTAIITTESYTITANELKLFYTYMGENRYLLFSILK